ncbi:MAG TPA: sugar transferase [Roseiflexaceae bacterium]|nr:sugar transferase [Roseiflexaceae bacterium]
MRLEISERRLLLRSVDTAIAAFCAFGALLFWALLAGRPFDLALVQEQIAWVLLILIGWPIWLALNDMYVLRAAARTSLVVRRLLLGGIVLAIIYLGLFFIAARTPVTGALPHVFGSLEANSPPLRFAPIVAIGASTFLLAVWRLAYIRVLAGPHTRRRLIILGAGRAGKTICDALVQSHNPYFEVVGFIDDDPAKQQAEIAGVPVLGPHEQMVAIAATAAIDEIVIAISTDVSGGVFQAVMDSYERGLAITPMPLLYEQLTGRVAVEHIGSQWYVALPIEPQSGRAAQMVVKRTLDLVCSLLLGLLLLLLLPLVALAIRLDSAGPIFYRQERLGRHGQRFVVHKFRSMTTDAERDGTPRWADSDDPRVTRVGRWLRRLRLDELPQVLNVVRGEMRMVGPRPERPEFIDQLQRDIPFYRTRLAARPGLTGWAQINYGYGSSVEDALIKLQYDLFYLKHQSLWFDIKILIRTIGVVLRMQGQ